MYRYLYRANIPKWLKILLIITLTLTFIYLIGVLGYRILESLRVFLHWASDKRNWWTFLMCILILLIGSLIISQFCLHLNPIGNFFRWIGNCFANFRNWLAGLIKS